MYYMNCNILDSIEKWFIIQISVTKKINNNNTIP